MTTPLWRPSADLFGLYPMDEPTTTQEHALGTRIQAFRADNNTAGKFVYLAGVAGCVRGSWVSFEEDDNQAVLLAANAIGRVAVALGACTASYYGWFQFDGKALGYCRTSLASNNNVWITASAGRVDDASVAGDGINNVMTASAVHVQDPLGTGTLSFLAEFELWGTPYTDNATSFS